MNNKALINILLKGVTWVFIGEMILYLISPGTFKNLF